MSDKPHNLPASNEAKFRDMCLSWGFPSVIILSISLFVAHIVGIAFGNSTFASIISFVICCMLLFLIYYTIFQSLPLSIYNMYKAKKELKSVTDSAPEETETASVDQNGNQPEEEKVELTQQQSSPVSDNESYDQRRLQFLKEQEEKRLELVNCVIAYTKHIMPGIMENADIDKLCVEVRNWADNPEYKPLPVRMNANGDKLDAKHYVWNISRRFGKEHFKLENRNAFIQLLFPDMFRDNDLESMKNLKLNPQKGTIKIDEPEEDSYLFAYQRQKNEE